MINYLLRQSNRLILKVTGGGGDHHHVDADDGDIDGDDGGDDGNDDV